MILTAYSSELASKLKAYPEFADRATDLAKDATSLVQWMKDAPPGPARTHMRTAYTESIRTVYIMAAVVALIATIASFWTKHYDLDQELQTEHALEDVDELATKDAERGHFEKGRLVKETSARVEAERFGADGGGFGVRDRPPTLPPFPSHMPTQQTTKLEGSKLRRQLSVR